MKNIRRLFLILTLLLPVTALFSSASFAGTKLEATIFSYDGTDFVRTETTLVRPTKPWSKNAPIPGQRPFLVTTTKPTTHRSWVKTAK